MTKWINSSEKELMTDRYSQDSAIYIGKRNRNLWIFKGTFTSLANAEEISKSKIWIICSALRVKHNNAMLRWYLKLL